MLHKVKFVQYQQNISPCSLIDLHRFWGGVCLDIRVRRYWKEQPLSKSYNLSNKLHVFISRRISNRSDFVTSQNHVHSAAPPSPHYKPNYSFRTLCLLVLQSEVVITLPSATWQHYFHVYLSCFKSFVFLASKERFVCTSCRFRLCTTEATRFQKLKHMQWAELVVWWEDYLTMHI
jgi:hypothetical protein